jgi:hypothetical protein
MTLAIHMHGGEAMSIRIRGWGDSSILRGEWPAEEFTGRSGAIRQLYGRMCIVA